MTNKFLILLFLIINWKNNVYCQNENDDEEHMSYVGLALEVFNPCEDGFIWIDREIGRRPSEENYWKGSIDLSAYKNIPGAIINLLLDNPAVLKLDEEMGRVSANGLGFRIEVFDPKKTIWFEVKAPQNKPFPNIVSVKLNGKRVCKNPQKWTPTIIGSKSTAISTVARESVNKYCGSRKIDFTELIVQGKSTRYGDWPWHVAIYAFDNKRRNQIYICGGTLVSVSTIITAAHCVTIKGQLRPSDSLVVIMGKYSLIGRDAGSQERQVTRIIVHDNFNSTTLRNDIAIIKLATLVSFDRYVQPACLWPENDIEKEKVFNKIGMIVGWGLNENETLSDELKEGNVTIVSDVQCLLSRANFFDRYVYNNSLCAGNLNYEGTSACNGDSGGGLFIPNVESNNKTSFYLRGIVSVAVSRNDKPICNPDYYVVFTDTAKYLSWINEHIG